jgi:hypothetical protein
MRRTLFTFAAALLSSSALAAPPSIPPGAPIPFGTTAGTAAAGDDSRITGAVQSVAPGTITDSGTLKTSTYGSLTVNKGTNAAAVYSPQVPGGWFTVDGIRSAVLAPSGSTAINTNGFGFYVKNQATASGLGGNAVGLYGTTTCEVNGCGSWGINPTVIDSTTASGGAGVGTGRKLIGGEFDISVTQSGTTVQGVSLLGSSIVQPGGGANGFSCGALGGPARWTQCFIVPDGVATGGMYLGAVGASGTVNSPSVPLTFTSYNGSGVGVQTQLQGYLGGFNVTNPALANSFYISPASTGNAPSISGIGTDAVVAFNIGPNKGNGATNIVNPLTTSTYASIGGFLNVNGPFTIINNSQVVPSAQLASGVTVNQSSSGETDYWNEFSTASKSFAFNQITGAGTFANLLTLSPTVNTSAKPVQLPTYTVAGLPTCNATYARSIVWVSDMTAPTYRGALVGGGTVGATAACDGTSWTSQ